MPSLREYILTLRKHNPGIADRAIKLYLLKDGWKIEEIENTFNELNGIAPQTPTVSMQPANEPAEKIAPAPVAPVATPVLTETPKPITAATPVIHQEIELQPESLLSSTPMSSSTSPSASKSISHPTFAQVQEQKQISGDAPIAGPSTSVIFPSAAAIATAVASSSVSVAKPEISATPVIPAPNISASMNATFDTVANGNIPKESEEPEVPEIAFPNVRVNSAPNSNIYASIGAGVPAARPQADSFGAPVPSHRPNFTYEQIMLGQDAQAPNPAASQPRIITMSMVEEGPVMPSPQLQAQTFATPIPVPPQQPVNNPYPGAMPLQTQSEFNSQTKTQSAATSMPISAQPLQQQMPKKPHRAGRAALWFIIILILLGGLGFVYMKYVHGVYLFVQAPFAREDFVKGFAASIAGLNTAEYDATISFGSTERSANAELLDLAYMARVQGEADMQSGASSTSSMPPAPVSVAAVPIYPSTDYQEPADSLLRMIPQDAKLELGLYGVFDKSRKSKDGKLGIKGSYTGDGISINADVESVKIGEKAFVRINTFPAFFFDISKIKDKWIAVTKEDTGDILPSGLWFNEAEGDSIAETDSQVAQKQVLAALEFFIEKQVLEVNSEPQKKAMGDGDKRTVFEYEVTPNLNNFITFVEQFPVRMQSKFKDGNYNPDDYKELVAYVKGEAFAYYFNYVKNHSKILIAVDTKGQPVSIDIQTSIAPKSDTLKKQLNTRFIINFKNVNKGIDLLAPIESIPFIDAYSSVTGKTKEDILFDRQVSTIGSLGSVIDTYQRYAGTMPESFADLKRSTADILAASSTFKIDPQADPYYLYKFSTSTRPLYTKSFKDAYDGADLTYQKTGPNSYTLVYTIKLPSIPRSHYEVTYGVGGYDYDNVATASTGNNSRPLLYLRHVNGLNTATHLTLSKEADAQKTKDTDRDRISDAMEVYLGTNIAKADTDGDGQADYDELRNGTNPKGPGAWIAQFETAQ